MSKKISNVAAAHKWAVKWVKKREEIERYGETMSPRMNYFIDKFSDPNNLPRSVRAYELQSMYSAAKSFGQQNRQMQSGTTVYNAFGGEIGQIKPVRLPYRKTTPVQNAAELNKAIEDIVNKAVRADKSSFLGVLENANRQISELLKSPGVEYTGDIDNPLSWDKSKVGADREIKPENVSINVSATKVDINEQSTRDALKRLHERVPYANEKVLREFKQAQLDNSYKSHLDKLSKRTGIDVKVLSALEDIMNTIAAWEYAKRGAMDSDQMVEKWQDLYDIVLTMDTSSEAYTDLRRAVYNYDSGTIEDIVNNLILDAMKGA